MVNAPLDSSENLWSKNPLTDEEADSLIYIADASVKSTEKRRHWFTLGIPITHKIHYGLEEQLEAIKKLGESRNKKALEYLERLAEVREEWIPGDEHILHPNDPGTGYYDRFFLNAKGGLYQGLHRHKSTLQQAIQNLKMSIPIE